MSTMVANIPGYTTGTWSIDPNNSDVSFSARHLGVSKAHGRFNQVTGKIVTGENPEKSSVSATISADGIDTGFPSRDSYIKGADVLATDEYGELTFVSSGVRSAGAAYEMDGDLTIRGVTRPVTLTIEIGGFVDDPTSGSKVAGASAKTTIKRSDFGLAKKVPAMVVSEDIELTLDIYAVLDN
jgi:polyisoprenoid-binding protein YceI